MLDVAKYILILLTAFLAVWGVFHEYKTNGRMNLKGYVAVACLVILCFLSALAELLSNRNKARENEVAAEQLKKENAQQEILLIRLEEVEKRIESNISYLEFLKKEISVNHTELKSTQNAIRKTTDLQVEQQRAIDKEIRKFSKKAELKLDRLSAPLSELYLSSTLKFVGAEKLFPEYYEYLKPDFYVSGVINFPSQMPVPRDFDYTKLHYFYPQSIEIAIYKYNKREHLNIKTLSDLEPELLLNTVEVKDSKVLENMYSNQDDGSILKTKYLVALTTKKSRGTITSQLDLTTLAQQGDYAIFSFISTYPETVELSTLMLHTDKSPFSGVSLDHCELIYRRSGINIIRNDGPEINNFRHVYSCKLWEASRLNER